MKKQTILHLCADTGSDTMPYQNDPRYNVLKVGASIGVENFNIPDDVEVVGVIANPVCLEFSTARSSGKARNPDAGMFLVNQCLRIIDEAKARGHLRWWVIENPARGVLHKYLGQPQYKYEPWWFGSPWTKQTALWGNFNTPHRRYEKWEDVPKNKDLYVRPNRGKPSIAFMHKSAYDLIPEFASLPRPDSDMEFRSLCSQKFAQAFYEVNP